MHSRFHFSLFVGIAVLLVAICPINSAFAYLVDRQATPETWALQARLNTSTTHGFMVGQQNATSSGVGWRDNGTEFCGDICRATGLHPAVYGWDYSEVFLKGEGDKEALRQKIIQAYEAGGVNTISWHMMNPVTFGSYNDLTPACDRILAGGGVTDNFLSALDNFADFLSKLKTRDGRPVPLVFRPWHEANANFFWWGASACGATQYKRLWAETIKRLRDINQVHQLLYAFSPNWEPNDGMYLYPGDDQVDVFGLDFYFFQPIAVLQRAAFLSTLQNLVDTARQKGKIAALTETGYENNPNHYWWTGVFLKTLRADGILNQISYAMLWRNDSVEHYYLPYAGEASTPDFMEMARDPASLFLEDVAAR